MNIYRQSRKGGSKTKNYYVDIYLDGKRKRLPLFESKSDSKRFADNLETFLVQKERGGSFDRNIELWLTQIAPVFLHKFVEWGLLDSGRVEGAKPLTQHVEDFRLHLLAKGDTAGYVQKTISRIQTVTQHCKFIQLSDISAYKIQQFVHTKTSSNEMSQSTGNHYIRSFKIFSGWLYKNDRIDKDPLKSLTTLRVVERRKQRRALAEAEISFLLEWLRTKAPKRRSLTGWERAVLYQLALTTGLRAAEIRSLTGRSIDFDSKTLHISSAYTKNRQEAILPLSEQIIDDLKTLTAGKHPDARLFKLTDKTAKLIRADLADAKKDYADQGQTPQEKTRRTKDDFLAIETADGEIDFHALRHSFGSMLAAAGVHPKTAQTLMRHSTITLTLDRYSHSFREAETAAVNALPSFNNLEKNENIKQA